MNNTMRNLTLSAAALAALTCSAPKAEAQWSNRGRGAETPRTEGRETQRREERGFRGTERREVPRQESRQRTDFRGREFRGGELRGREFHGDDSRGRAYYRGPAFTHGRGFVSPFRLFAGSRFYSYRPGPGYFFVSDLGWVLPPFPGAVWVPAHTDFDGFFVEGYWR